MRSRAAIAVLAGLLLAASGPASAGNKARTGTAQRAAPKTAASSRPAARPTSQLDRARASLAALKKDPARRRYRHNWERAIRDLEKAARGPDTAPALLDAARARYALYRFSAVESDREKALALARRSAKAGSQEAKGLAAAIRREAGDDEPRPRGEPQAIARKSASPAPAAGASLPRKGAAPAQASPAAPVATAPLRPASAPPAPAPVDDEPSEPVLDEAVAQATEGVETAAGSGEAPSRSGAPARVSEVQTWSGPGYTRVAVYLSEPVSFDKQEIPPDPDHPRRLALDLKGAVLAGPSDRRSVADALVRQVRTAQHAPDVVRVVLDLNGQEEYQLFTLADPPRVIVDVGSSRTDPGPVARPARPSLPVTPPTLPAVPEDDGEGESPRRAVRHVIVDAGHGGHDTGAIGPRGVREKDVTLSMARRLAARLRAEGFKVTLTRNDDRYLKLEERTAIANMARGDLFISVHANAHPKRDRHGVETYFLNVTDDRYARRLAARENGVIEGAEEEKGVQRILTDLNATASAGESRRLARMVQRELTTRVRSREGEVRDLGVKNALFYVLLGARMPAVLVETAFISNRIEEKRLASPAYQQLVADGVTQAVLDYSGSAHVAAR